MPRPLEQPMPDPVFAESTVTGDPRGFSTPHPSDDALYKTLGNLLKTEVVGFSPARGAPSDVYELAEALGSRGHAELARIKKAGKIIFHALGDSGASNAGKYKNEIRASDQLSADLHQSDEANRPAFLFHLGYVVYDFGESKYYYDQFYEPFRDYAAPIFAVPGNHDAFVVPGTPQGETPLEIFERNFCAPSPMITPEAASLHRTAMTQPGIYFTLDAPFVRIIGLFSNALEDPGVISSQNGKWPAVPDAQLAFLDAQLTRVKADKFKGALILAVHHPPFSYAPPKNSGGTGGSHGCSSDMLREIDGVCKKRGVYPHAFLSAHAHNYQRYTRTIHWNAREDFEVPFIVCGDGGHNVNRLARSAKGRPTPEPHVGTSVDYLESKPAIKSGGLTLKKFDDTNYGYLRVHVDEKQLQIGFHQIGQSSLAQSQTDAVTVDIATHKVVKN